jgi:tRNA modification GTPase
MLVDLAGLDENDSSSMNVLMQDAARSAIDRAELILRCAPIDQPALRASNFNELLVCTKCDLRPLAPGSAGGAINVSAISGHGLDTLRTAIAQRLSTRAVSLAADSLALRPRHEAALRSTLEHLAQAISWVEPAGNERSLPNPELIAAAMRSSLDDLSGLAGDITPDDILGRVFATFCVGK